MAKKKKKRQHTHKAAATKAEIAEEILALAAIYDADFSLHDDGLGFQLLVVPHPGYHSDNHATVELHVRYTAGYPATPLQLKLRNQVGLSSDDVRELAQQLEHTAATFAQQESVCVFNLVDECQEFLREHNEEAQAAQAAAAAAEAAAAAGDGADGAGGAGGGQSEPLSLWHEMQRRQQADEAAALMESEVSVGGVGLQGPGGVLGEDLWMFDGGLFAEEGEPSFALPNINSQQPQGAGGPKGRRPPKGSAAAAFLRPDVSPEPLYRLATSPKTPNMMAGRSPKQQQVSTPLTAGRAAAAGAAGAAGGGAGGGGGLKAAAVAAMAGSSSSPAQQRQQHAAAGSAAVPPRQPQQQEQQPQRPDEDTLQQSTQQQQHEGSTHGTVVRTASGRKLLLSHSHSCSFSNLPKGLQQLLNSGDGSRHKHRKGRHKHKQQQQGQQQQQQQQAEAADGGAAAPSGRVESLVFGDIDSSVYRRLSSDSAAATAVKERRSGAGAGDAEGGSSSSSSDGYDSDSSTSSSGSGSSEGRRASETGAGGSRMQRSESEEGSGDAEEEEGPSLRSQLLLGHLLLLAANAVSGPAAAVGGPLGTADGSSTISSSTITSTMPPSAATTSIIPAAPTTALQPASVQVLAGHLRRSGLLPKWVFFLLKQLPQRPELFERAFNRLFQQEIQECSTADAAPTAQPHPSQVLKLFWDRQAAAAAGSASLATASTATVLTASDPASSSMATTTTATAAGLLGGGASAGMRTGSGAAAAVAAATAAAAAIGGADAAVGAQGLSGLSRYRTDFEELIKLGQGGFGVVVAAVNRLDGRKYAVKKIRLQPGGSSSSYSRILREVATLSRLQHPNVVRYYQAWTEQAQAEDADVDAEPSDGGEWGDLSGSETDSESGSDSEQSTTDSDEEEESANTQQRDSTSVSIAPTSTVFSSAASGSNTAGDSDGSSSSSGDDDGSSRSSSSSSDGSESGLFGDPSISIPPNLPVPVRKARGRQTPKTPRAEPKQRPPKSSSGAAKRRSRPAGPSQILYIQMEFCPRTLAQVLESGSLDEEDFWVVLRGILAGLAHIHSQGAIHRDLKPANIFYDSKGEVKLGDFGLAKFQAQQARQAGLDADGAGAEGTQGGSGSPRLAAHQRLSSLGGAAAMSAAAPSDVTGVCGTGFYISPEIANGWASYDEKVDLYSLGVVVFEMCHPFSTGMERAVLLRELREAGKLPPAFEAAHPQVARLIRWLMSPKPADRPSARQVLQSDLLPPRLEDEQLKDLLRSLPDNEIAYERVVDSLFSISTSREPQATGLGPPAAAAGGKAGGSGGGGGGSAARALQALTPARAASGGEGLQGAGLLASQQGPLPLGELPGAPLDAHLELNEVVTKAVRDVAVLHGAVQMSSAPLGLSHLGLPRDAVRFLAPSGAVVALRYEVRYPLAAWFAQQAALAGGSGGGGSGPAYYSSNSFGSSGSGSSSFGLGGGAFGAASALEHGLKRFEVCRVQRAGRGGRGLPASYLTADFDIISPSGVGTGGAGRERLLAEAEVIKVVTQVLDAMPELGPYEIRLGHTHILSAAISGMALPPGVSPASVMALLASASAVSAAAHGGSEGVTSSGGAAPGGSSSSASGPSAAGVAAGGASEAGGGGGQHGGGGSHHHHHGQQATQHQHGQPAAAGGGGGNSSAEGGSQSGGAQWGGVGGRAHTWPAIRVGLDGLGLDSTPVSRCRQCVLQLPGPLFAQLPSLRSFLRELRPLLGSSAITAALSAVDELQALGQLLLEWGVGRDQLLLEPLLTPQAEYFSGALFQVLLQSHSHHHAYSVIHTSAVAAGGRYDALLRSLWSPAAATLMPAPGAVGVTLNCEKLVKLLTALQRRQQARAGTGLGGGGGGAAGGGASWGHGAAGGLSGLLLEGGGRQPCSQCDVLVCARGGDGRLQVRMALLAQLWAAGIAAQMLPREGPSLAEQYEYADAVGAKWLVIIDDKANNMWGNSQQHGGVVRVKRWRRGPDDSSRKTRGEDSSVAVADLVRFLQLGLSGAQDPSKGIVGGGGAAPSSSGVGDGGGGGGGSGQPGSFSSVGFVAAGSGSLSHHHRSLLLHRSGSGGDLRGSRGPGDSSLESWESGVYQPESGGGREGHREGGAGEGRVRDRDREQQGGGRHRDRRR